MKLFAYIASRRHSKSNTLKVFEILLSEIIKQNKSVKIETTVCTPDQLGLLSCQGCLHCFNYGNCPLDTQDSFDIIKNNILKSDIIILGTPVYAATVSGDMKVFIDRLSYWLHLMPLAGKIGIGIVTASSNSVLETSSYLKRIIETLGLCFVNNISCTVDSPRMLESNAFITNTIPQYAKEVSEYIMGRKIDCSPFQDKLYRMFREIYNLPGKVDNAEINYWQNKGVYETYSEYLDAIQQRN